MRSKEDMLKVLAAGRAKRMANLKAKKGEKEQVGKKKVEKKVMRKKKKCTCEKDEE